VAVIGGSFLPRHGGHNPLEAAVFGKAIIFGPHMSNFKEIAGLLIQEHAARRCPAQALPATLLELLRDPRTRQELGQRAMAAMSHNQGATEITIRLILSHTGRAK
jgi:3-deoxy-D-manno-octulosonic-acid transferase